MIKFIFFGEKKLQKNRHGARGKEHGAGRTETGDRLPAHAVTIRQAGRRENGK
jgi:hypothetical protein